MWSLVVTGENHSSSLGRNNWVVGLTRLQNKECLGSHSGHNKWSGNNEMVVWRGLNLRDLASYAQSSIYDQLPHVMD